MPERLGELLVQLGAVRSEDVARMLRVQQERGGRLGALLLQHGLLDEDTLLKALARQQRIPFAEARWFKHLEPRIIRLVPKAMALRHRLVPLRLMDKRLVVATCDADNLERTAELNATLGNNLRPVLARRADIEQALVEYFGLERPPQIPEGDTNSDVHLLVKRKAPSRPTVPPPISFPSVTTSPDGVFSGQEDAELRELFATADKDAVLPPAVVHEVHVTTVKTSHPSYLESEPVDLLAWGEDGRTTLDIRPPPDMRPPPLLTRARKPPPLRPAPPTPAPVSLPVVSPPQRRVPPPEETTGVVAPPPPLPEEAAPVTVGDIISASAVPDVAQEELPPQGLRFGPYVLLKRVKAGGMAEVFVAKTGVLQGFERRVAIKRILPHLTTSTEFVEMFIDEAKLTSQLNHPNIAHIHDFGMQDGTYYIAMEYVDGRDVNNIFREAFRRKMKLPVGICSYIIQQACEGLDYAHRKRDENDRPLGIVHRDVSPANVLVGFDGTVKIIDFGIAKAVSKLSMTRPGLIKGKISYMSPEQMRGQPIDHRSDVFALGIILYEILSGRRLFASKTDVETIRNVIKGSVPPLQEVRPDIPAALLSIVDRALQKDRDERYAWAADMGADLQTLLLTEGMRDPRGDVTRFMAQVMSKTEPT